MSNLPVSVPQQGHLPAGGRPMAIVPQTMGEVLTLANAVYKSGLAPDGFRNPEAVMVAMLHGAELGMTPMTALQSIAVVNGRPSVWGDGALGLVRASGLLESFKEWIEGTGDDRVAYCRVKRRNDPDIVTGEFSVEKAKTAKLWGKGGPWTNYPDRMLQMRARAFALRDKFTDILRGLYIAEELQGSDEMRDVTPRTSERPPAPADVPVLAEDDTPPAPPDRSQAPADTAATSAEPEKPSDPDSWSENEFDDEPEDYERQAAQIRKALEATKNAEELEQVREMWADRVHAMPKEFRTGLTAVVKACRSKFAGGQ